MTKKRGRIPSLITGSSGKPAKVVALRTRKCNRCEMSINSGESCFEIPKVGGGFSSKKPYCHNCFRLIIEQTQKDISILETGIEDKN